MLRICDFRKIFISFIVILLFTNLFYEKSCYAWGVGDITLSWNAPTSNEDGSAITDLSGYKLYYGTEPGIYTECIDVGSVLNYQINNLGIDRTYYFALTAYDTSGNESRFSHELSRAVQTADTTPPVISVVYISNITANSATIHWLTDEASDSQVEYGTSTSYGHVTTLDNSLETIHSQTLSLLPSTRYYYKIYSRDASGNLVVSVNRSFMTNELSRAVQISDTTPPVISVVYVNNITGNSATIHWVTNEASDSQVEYGTSSSYGHVTTLDNSLETIHSQTLSLLPSMRYYYKIYSRDASGNLVVSVNRSFMTK